MSLAASAALAWKPAIDPIGPPARASFDPAVVRKGAMLAAVGNCIGCHGNGEMSGYAGGLGLATPFGTIYSTNITPDPVTGIGHWSEAAFSRAMREGVSRDGHLLYPAFPYNHFTHSSEDDLAALYAFMMTRDPVEATPPRNDLAFPLGFRPLMAGWNVLFLDRKEWAPEGGHSAEWNRGAYLAESLGHCSACHSPLNALGSEDPKRHYDGGEAEGWYVPAINRHSPSPQPWSVDQLATYLRTGIVDDHAMAGGPMQGVVSALAHADAADVRAIAVYVASQMGEPDADKTAIAAASKARAAQGPLAAAREAGATDAVAAPATADTAMLTLGASVYAGACASCHDRGRDLTSNGALRLPLAVAVYDPDPRSLIHIVRDGIQPSNLQPGRWMPGFAGSLDDAQVTALLAYLRHQAADAPPWPDLASQVRKTRSP